MQKWNTSIPWVKKSDYILRCIEEIFAPSSGGNPMATLKFEVAAPDTVIDNDGEELQVSGVRINFWQTIKSISGWKDTSPEEATEQLQANFIKLLTAFELPTDNIDWENPALGFKGKLVYVMLEDNEQAQRGSPTKADLAKGIKIGPILVHPKTKKELVSHYPKINSVDSFFGTAVMSGTGGL
jgi:hypothetical protein